MWLDGHLKAGAGLAFASGHWQFVLREDVTFAYAATTWLTLRAGLGLGTSIDTATSPWSLGEVALPLSVTFLDWVEVQYRPMISVPFGLQASPALGGTHEHSARLAVLPFEVALRVRISALGW